nr:hypothetical protein [uncultured Prevotella sp.]
MNRKQTQATRHNMPISQAYLGKATTHLPVQLIDNEGQEETFTWRLSTSSYPTSMVRSNAPNWTNTFTW